MIPAFFVFLSNTGGSTLLNDATNIYESGVGDMFRRR